MRPRPIGRDPFGSDPTLRLFGCQPAGIEVIQITVDASLLAGAEFRLAQLSKADFYKGRVFTSRGP